jgi:hypothetical protein
MDTSVPQFYPTLFVLVTDVMDTVGNLVWDRIKRKSEADESNELVALLPGEAPSNNLLLSHMEFSVSFILKIEAGKRFHMKDFTIKYHRLFMALTALRRIVFDIIVAFCS